MLAELRIKPDPDVGGDEAGWHANLLAVENDRCMLFTHDETLFSFLLCGLTRPDFEHVPEVFGQGLFKALLHSGFSQGEVEYMLENTRQIRFSKTNNRRVLGSMNEMAHMLELTISSNGGLAAAAAFAARKYRIDGWIAAEIISGVISAQPAPPRQDPALMPISQPHRRGSGRPAGDVSAQAYAMTPP